jgi:D-arabinose 1-dehydrogenase-like Zn-dependent alcohol dehydrogenase
MSTQCCYCLTDHHGALEMRERPIPQPKGGEVRVKVTGAGGSSRARVRYFARPSP